MTPNAPPPPKGRMWICNFFLDFNQTGDQCTRWSQNGFRNDLNMSPVMAWSSLKNKATIEPIMFENGDGGTKNSVESLRGLCYKLHMLGVFPLVGHLSSIVTKCQTLNQSQSQGRSPILVTKCQTFNLSQCQGRSPIQNATTQCKKSAAIGKCITSHVSTPDNPANLCT